MKNERESFVLYHNYANMLDLLSNEDSGILFKAIFQYTRSGTVANELPPMVKMAFVIIKDTLDRDAVAYEDKCKLNAENGKKGGRPRKNTEHIFLEKTERFFEKAKKADNDNDNDNGNDNGNGNENDNDNGNDNGNGNDNDNEGGCAPLALACDCAEHKENDEIDEPVEPSTDICSAEAPPTYAPHAPRLSEEERMELIKKGLSEGYIDERLQRAVTYAKARQKSMFAVLLEWWQTDREKAMRKRSVGVGNGGYGYNGGNGYNGCNGYNGGNSYSGASTQSEPSYDIEKFFEAATKRTLEEVV